jgi:hypothetical protein
MVEDEDLGSAGGISASDAGIADITSCLNVSMGDAVGEGVCNDDSISITDSFIAPSGVEASHNVSLSLPVGGIVMNSAMGMDSSVSEFLGDEHGMNRDDHMFMDVGGELGLGSIGHRVVADQMLEEPPSDPFFGDSVMDDHVGMDYEPSSAPLIHKTSMVGNPFLRGDVKLMDHEPHYPSRAQPKAVPVPAARNNPAPASHHNQQTDSPSVCARSRYGRRTAVTNFARLLDPMSRSNSPSSDVAKEVRSPSAHAPEEANSSASMVDTVRALVYKIGAPPPSIAAAAVNPHSDKYIGVRLKQSGFGAVIKKNHSEINLGIYDSAEEAARAYDMAALFCQGERAKVNFSDSLDLYDAHYTPDLKLPVSPMRDKDFYTLYFLSMTATPRGAGFVLTDLADRLPYSAVRCIDSAVWEEYSAKNDNLNMWAEFGAQILWLVKHQLIDDVISQAWRMQAMPAWEALCTECMTGEHAAKVLQEAEQTAVDWDKVAAMWDSETNTVNPMGRTRSSIRRGDYPLGRGAAQLSNEMATKDKRKRDVIEEPACDPAFEGLGEFARLNSHLVTTYSHDPFGYVDGIGPTLDVIRSQRKTQRVHAIHIPQVHEATVRAPSTPVVQPQQPQHAPQHHYEREQRTAAPQVREMLHRPERISSHNNHRGVNNIGSQGQDLSKNSKGLVCRFCGKAFTHAPAHLQHERAHLQQQETMNPSSRIYQYMPTSSSSSPRISRDTSKLDVMPALEARARSTGALMKTSGLSISHEAPQIPVKPRQVSKFLLELAARLPMDASTLHDSVAWEQWGVVTAKSDTVQQVCDQMDWLVSRIDDRVMSLTWTEACRILWKTECESCDSGPELMSLASRFERDALDWGKMEQFVAQARLINVKQALAAADSADANGADAKVRFFFGICDFFLVIILCICIYVHTHAHA